MDCDATPPVLETKRVLLNHLKAKIQSIKNILVTEDLLEELTEDLSNKDIINLLENESRLLDRIEKSKTCELVEKQTIGEDLFVAVSQIDSELCAQLTGMLLELDVRTIKNLLKDSHCLEQAVYKAKQEYLRYTKGNTRYLLGEELFHLIFDRYPDQELAGQLTGMLLELDTDTLHRVMCTPKELDEKLGAAYSVLIKIKEK